MKIYTKTGDSGRTGLSDGSRVSKDDLRIETYGTLDELNSQLGVAIAGCAQEELRDLLMPLQSRIFDLSADLATPLDAPPSPHPPAIHRITPADIAALEAQIDALTPELPPLRRFILPGGSPTAAHLHVARTVARRAERLLVSLMAQENVGPHPLVFLNRFSDLLFTLARYANHLDQTPEALWQGPAPSAGQGTKADG